MAAVCWSFNGLLIKLINDSGQGPGGVAIAFYRSLFAGLFLLPFWVYRKNRIRKTQQTDAGQSYSNPKFQLLICFSFFACMTVCFVVANTMTEAANAIVLQYTSIVWVFLLSPILLKEHFQNRDLLPVLVALIGVAIIFFENPENEWVGADYCAICRNVLCAAYFDDSKVTKS